MDRDFMIADLEIRGWVPVTAQYGGALEKGFLRVYVGSRGSGGTEGHRPRPAVRYNFFPGDKSAIEWDRIAMVFLEVMYRVTSDLDAGESMDTVRKRYDVEF